MKKGKKAAAALLAAVLMVTAAGCGQQNAGSSAENAGAGGASSTEAAASAQAESTETAGGSAETAAESTVGSSGTESSAGSSGAESSAAEDASGGTGDGELRELNIVLDWYPNAIHTFLYTAIERGYYRDEGLDVKIRFPANDNDGLALVAAGKVELSVYYQQDVIQAVVNQGVGIRSIGAVCQTPLNVILSMKDKNVNSPKDFVGKTVGYGGTALSEAMVKAMMENVGEDPSSVTLQNVGFDLMSSMTTGQVDATIGCLVNHEVPQLEEEGFDVNWFPLTDYGIPNFYEVCILANNDLIENEPDTLRAFLRASKKGFNDFKADPDGTLQILLDNQNAENFPLTPSVEKKSAETLLPRMEQEGKPFLSQTEECWQENIDWMLDQKLIDRKPEVSEVMADLGV